MLLHYHFDMLHGEVNKAACMSNKGTFVFEYAWLFIAIYVSGYRFVYISSIISNHLFESVSTYDTHVYVFAHTNVLSYAF